MRSARVNGTEGRDMRLVQSVDRAFAILELLAARGWAGATELGLELEIHKSTAFRLLATLQNRGIVERDPETSKYRLGPGIARLARDVEEKVDLRHHARDAMRSLGDQTLETVNLAVLDGSDVVYIDQYAGSSAILSADWLGHRTPVHCTAAGKVFLAFMSPPSRPELLITELEKVSERTIVDARRLKEQMECIRQDGYATTVGELEIGLNAAAAPIFSASGEVVASLTVSGPESRMSEGELARVGEQTRRAADSVSRRLGYQPQPVKKPGAA